MINTISNTYNTPLERGDLHEFPDEVLLNIFKQAVHPANPTCQDLRTLRSLRDTCRSFRKFSTDKELDLPTLRFEGSLTLEDFKNLGSATGYRVHLSKDFMANIELEAILDDLLTFLKHNYISIIPEADGSVTKFAMNIGLARSLLHSSFCHSQSRQQSRAVLKELLTTPEIQVIEESDPNSRHKFCANLVRYYTFSQIPIGDLLSHIFKNKIEDDITLSLMLYLELICSRSPENSEEILSKECYKKTRSAFFHELVGGHFKKISQDAKALEHLNAALKINSKSVFALLTRGSALRDHGRHQEALSDLNETLRLCPLFPGAALSRGVIYSNMNRPDLALSDYNEALRLDSSDICALRNRGVVLADLNRNEEALSDFNEALRLDPSDIFALRNRGVVLNRLNRHEGALSDFNEAFRLAPPDTYTLRNRGVALANLNRNIEALSDFNEALRLDPLDIFALRNRGVALANLNLNIEALADFNEVLRLAPKDIDALKKRSVVYERLARADTETVLKIKGELGL